MNEEKIKSYFLGKLAGPEAENFEFETAANADLTEQAQAIESELIDNYLRGNLSAGENRLFKDNYLTTKARRDKLQDAQNLWKVITEDQKAIKSAAAIPSVAATPKISFWQAVFSNRNRLALSGLVLLFLIGGIVWIWKDSETKSEIAGLQSPDQTPAPLNEKRKDILIPASPDSSSEHSDTKTNVINPVPQNIELNKKNSQSLPKSEIKTIPPNIEPPISPLATFILMPGALRGDEGEQFIKITSQKDKIKLHLTLPPKAAKFQSYRAVLKDAEGETIMTLENLKSPDLILPAGTFENRTYMIFLEGRNAGKDSESLKDYTFRVRR